MNGTYHQVYAHYGIRTLDYKLIYYYCDPLSQKGSRNDSHKPYWELYDLKKDPYEVKNVYGDPEYKEIQEDLTAQLHEIQQEVGDTPYSSD